MCAAQRDLDVVIYGATGFVGRVTAQYLAEVGSSIASGWLAARPSGCARSGSRSATARNTGR
jgi:short subunit dehydrogenase-like uncharacterized protein